MSQYAAIKNGTVTHWFSALPFNWNGAQRVTAMSDEERAAIGIVPVIDQTETFSTATHRLVKASPFVAVFDDRVEITRPVELIPPKVLTEADYIYAVQQVLDGAARQRGYDNIFSAVTYAEESAVEQFQLEGQAFRLWRSLVWAHCYQLLDDVTNGIVPAPTMYELLSSLPALVLPT